jgi:hypothetical protein
MTHDEALKITSSWEMQGYAYAGAISHSWMRDHAEPPDAIPDNDCPECGEWDTTTMVWENGITITKGLCYCPACEHYWITD